MVLPEFIGKHRVSPFQDIVQNCPATVFESPLMEYAVKFKWGAGAPFIFRTFTYLAFESCSTR